MLNSHSRLYDDGFAQAKAGGAPLDRQLFETKADYDAFMRGYNDAKKEKAGARQGVPAFIGPCSGIVGSGVSEQLSGLPPYWSLDLSDPKYW
jgi:hypothetical protein